MFSWNIPPSTEIQTELYVFALCDLELIFSLSLCQIMVQTGVSITAIRVIGSQDVVSFEMHPI